MERIGSSPPQKKVVLALEEANGLVRFASPEACNALFGKIAKFSREVLESKKEVHRPEQALSIESSCSCLFAGVCDPSARAGVCFCCERTWRIESDMVEFFDSIIDDDGVKACASCLCLLRQQPFLF